MKRHPTSICTLWQELYCAGRAFGLLHSQEYFWYHHMRDCYVWAHYFHRELHNHRVQCDPVDFLLRVCLMRTPALRQANSFRCLEIGFQLVMLVSVFRKWFSSWGIGIQSIPLLRTIGMDSLLVLLGCSSTFPGLYPSSHIDAHSSDDGCHHLYLQAQWFSPSSVSVRIMLFHRLWSK
jgi:hypothetical protein